MIRIIATALIAIAAALMWPAPASAQPAVDSFTHDAALVCRLLDIDSSPAMFRGMILEMFNDGLSADQAKAIMNYAVSNMCPEYNDELIYAAGFYRGRGFVA